MLARTKVKTKSKKREKRQIIKSLEKTAMTATYWIGSIQSLIVHTIIFISAFMSVLFGISFDRVLLALTTVLSLEAIYLAIFIQMSVNQNTIQLAQVEKDVEEIQEDIDEIQENVEEIAEDVDEIQEDVEHIEKDIDEIQEDVEEIEKEVEEIADDVEDLAEEEKK